ncbi:MAG: hypothetical protein PHX54_12275 [Lentimicrobiaceae bacterium]|nr:hypothetical protein [Lentimicrobiaceae bacterium]
MTKKQNGFIISESRNKIGLNEMKYDYLLKFLAENNMQIFTFNDLKKVIHETDGQSLKRSVYNWMQAGIIIRLKRGLYQIAYPKKADIPDLYIANRMYEPSYISLETVLSLHSIIPDVSVSVTSVSSKATRIFSNASGQFIYRTIKAEFFKGYYIMNENGYEIKIAEPEKAVVDYLYLNRVNVIDRMDKNALSSLSTSRLQKYSKLMRVDIGGLCA